MGTSMSTLERKVPVGRLRRGPNVAGFFHITQRAVEVMLAEGSGHVIQITTSLVEHANSCEVADVVDAGCTSRTRRS